MDTLGQYLILQSKTFQYWPRRLLHIPTMCSLERQEGTIYGVDNPFSEPPYAMLNYTWARYVDISQAAALTGAAIGGIGWKTPSIDLRLLYPTKKI